MAKWTDFKTNHYCMQYSTITRLKMNFELARRNDDTNSKYTDFFKNYIRVYCTTVISIQYGYVGIREYYLTLV